MRHQPVVTQNCLQKLHLISTQIKVSFCFVEEFVSLCSRAYYSICAILFIQLINLLINRPIDPCFRSVIKNQLIEINEMPSLYIIKKLLKFEMIDGYLIF